MTPKMPEEWPYDQKAGMRELIQRMQELVINIGKDLNTLRTRFEDMRVEMATVKTKVMVMGIAAGALPAIVMWAVDKLGKHP